jgi:hypothetical protein
VRKVKRANRKTIEAVNHNHVMNMNCENMGEGEQSLKRQRMEVMWRDEEGDVVEVETDPILNYEVGLQSSSAK